MTTTALAAFMVPREGGNATAIFMLQMLAIFVIFYFLLIRPQTQEKKRHREMLAKIKKGDEVVTSGGIIGKVVHAEQDRLTVKTGENTRLTVERARVARVVDPKAPSDAKD